jgi:hypothetical protein
MLTQDQFSTGTPPHAGHYLVITNEFPKNCPVMVAEYYEGKFYCESSEVCLRNVTHWLIIDKNITP